MIQLQKCYLNLVNSKKQENNHTNSKKAVKNLALKKPVIFVLTILRNNQHFLQDEKKPSRSQKIGIPKENIFSTLKINELLYNTNFHYQRHYRRVVNDRVYTFKNVNIYNLRWIALIITFTPKKLKQKEDCNSQ
jgi:ankyrin repeat protein